MPHPLHEEFLGPANQPPYPAVLDTDTYNEIDDQFALAYALLAPEAIALQAVYAAPFHNHRSTGPAQGMALSFDEIQRVLQRMNLADPPPSYRGSSAFLDSQRDAQASDAVDDLIQRAHRASPGKPMTVICIGAITNLASALLIEPAIASNLVVIWLGGHPHDWPKPGEFNLKQDVEAARIVLESDARFLRIPAKNVSEHLRTTTAEVRQALAGVGPIGDYLLEIFEDFAPDRAVWSKAIWDIAAIGWLINPDWVPTASIPRPSLSPRMRWTVPTDEPPSPPGTLIATHTNRDAIFGDFFQRAAAMDRQ